MSALDDLMKKVDEIRAHTRGTWPKNINDSIDRINQTEDDVEALLAIIDAQAAEIDRLTSENAALTRQAMRADSIAHRALDLNDKVIKENAELRQTDAPSAPSAAPAASDTTETAWLAKMTTAKCYPGKHQYVEALDGMFGINGTPIPYLRCTVCDHVEVYDDETTDLNDYLAARSKYLFAAVNQPPAPARAADDAANLGVSGVMTVAEANTIKPVDTHGFFYAERQVTGIEQSPVNPDLYKLYLDISDEVVVHGNATLTYRKWQPQPPRRKPLTLGQRYLLQRIDENNGFIKRKDMRPHEIRVANQMFKDHKDLAGWRNGGIEIWDAGRAALKASER